MDNGGTIGGLLAIEVDRVLLCGKCPSSTIPTDLASTTFRKAIDEMTAKITRLEFRGRILAPEKPKVEQTKDKPPKTTELERRIAKLREQINARSKV